MGLDEIEVRFSQSPDSPVDYVNEHTSPPGLVH